MSYAKKQESLLNIILCLTSPRTWREHEEQDWSVDFARHFASLELKGLHLWTPFLYHESRQAIEAWERKLIWRLQWSSDDGTFTNYRTRKTTTRKKGNNNSGIPPMKLSIGFASVSLNNWIRSASIVFNKYTTYMQDRRSSCLTQVFARSEPEGKSHNKSALLWFLCCFVDKSFLSSVLITLDWAHKFACQTRSLR